MNNASDPAIGVQFHGMWSNYSDAQRQLILDQMKTAGVKWVRLDLSWAMLQPTGPGSYDMTWGVPFADRVINMIHADGMHALVTFWLTPPWANGGAGETTLPTKASDYANALQWAAARYQGKVDAWEVWNEPNEPYSMAGADPAAYAGLLRAAYPAAHAGDPGTTVVFGGPSENDAPWIQRAYAAGIHGSFDAMATHPYMGPSNAPPTTPDDGTIYKLTHVAAVHDLMAANGDGAKPIWFTEFGWSSHTNTAGMQNWELGVTPQQQGDYLVSTLQLLKQSYPYVTNAFWYEANDEQTGTTVNNDNYGLLNSSLAPKPAYTALAGYLAANSSTPAPAPTPTATPTSTATPNTAPSPTPSTSPAPTTSPTSTTSPTATPSTSPTPAPSTSPTPTASPTPTIAAHGPKKRPYRSNVTLSAHLGWRVTGAPVIGAPVSMTAQSGSSAWRSLGTLRTDTRGNVALVVRATRSMTVRFAYASAGAPTVVATQHLTVTPTVTARPSTAHVRHGRSFTLTGRVAPGAARMLVKRELFYGGHWHVVGATRTTASGVFRFRVHTAHAATLRYRLVLAAVRGRAAVASPTLKVRIY